MRTNTLGNTGLKVSALGFGGGPLGGFYGGFEEAESIRALHLAIDRGVNLVDTSPYYGGGKSEEILGKGLKGGWRDKVVLATKCGPMTSSSSPIWTWFSPKHSMPFKISSDRANVVS